ncbi:M15 family metallopeptidase [Nocardioides sp. Bht2]|uniref:M15 family metallopeptidase n=1 Tax=Nocardioides sp. Bht2 TaxID=3392297 RepID=UPI0039B4CCCB
MIRALMSVAAVFLMAATTLSLEGVASAAPSGTAPVILDVDASTAWEDRPVLVSGSIAPGTSSTVQLWWRRAGSAQPGSPEWTPVGSAVPVDSTGDFATTLTWATPGLVELQARTTAGDSAPVTFEVGDRRVQLAQLPATSRVVADRITLAGQVTPVEAGVAVRLTWTSAGTSSTATVSTDAGGAFKKILPVTTRTGPVRARAETGTGGALERSESRRTTVSAVFASSLAPVNAAMVKYSYRAGCPVGPAKLTQLTMTYRTYAGTYRAGRMIVAKAAVKPIRAAFRAGFNAGFRIRRMVPVEAYRGSDPKAMRANNTSAFNCRSITGDPTALSPHAYGTAVDINTVQNPYRDTSGTWWPSRNKWINRNLQHPGMIKNSSAIRREFGRQGFTWGGIWRNPDWQHFDPRGRITPRVDVAARSVAGFDASDLPRRLPGGFRATAVEGGHEEGFLGNGTHVRARETSELVDGLRFMCRGSDVAAAGVVTALQGTYHHQPKGWAHAFVVKTITLAAAGALVQELEACSSPLWQVTAQQSDQVVRLRVVPRGMGG